MQRGVYGYHVADFHHVFNFWSNTTSPPSMISLIVSSRKSEQLPPALPCPRQRLRYDPLRMLVSILRSSIIVFAKTLPCQSVLSQSNRQRSICDRGLIAKYRGNSQTALAQAHL